MVDDENLGRHPCGFQLESDLHLNRDGQRRRRVLAADWMRKLRAPTVKLGVVGSPVEGEVIFPIEPRLIEDRAVEHGSLQQADEVTHVCVLNEQCTWPLEAKHSGSARIPGA